MQIKLKTSLQSKHVETMSKRTSSDAALADTSPNERAPTAAAATPTTMRRASEIDALLAWNGAAELAAVPPLPLETLRRVQRKLAFVKLLVDDAARRAAAPSATLAALQLVVRDDVRAHERCKVFQLTFEPSTSDLRVCEEPRDPHANAARAAAAKRTQAYALRIAAESEPLPPNLMPSRYTKKTKGSDDSATKAAAASSSTAAATPSSSVASTAAAAAAAGAAGGGGAAVPSPSVHASNFVEMERVCDVAFDFGAARIALRAVLYHRRELTCETIHYRIWFGSHTEPRKSATANSAIDSLFALLQRPVDMRNQADDRERPVFEWLAVRTFETDGVRQLQYVPETFVRRQLDGALR
jgi:hypothetical protein